MGDNENQTDWPVGETATVTIDYYSNSDNAIITDNRDVTVNIGPLTCPPGTEVTAGRASEQHAMCLDREHWADNYQDVVSKFPVKWFTNPITDWPVGEIRTVEITSISNSQNRLIRYGDGTQINIGNADIPIGTPVTVAHVHGYVGVSLTPEHWPDNYFDRIVNLVDPQNGNLSYKLNRDKGTLTIKSAKQEDTFELIEDEPSIETAQGSTPTVSDSTSSNPAASTATEPANTPSDLGKLREQAEEQATENPNVSVEETHTREFSRSEKIKQYAKKRAGGTCEGCRDPAPFTSTTGEPYLHAHHVHELSDGGADTPETVIALCPNCHYRVHHGEDGDAYNQELIEVLASEENVSVEAITPNE
jgi:hypothetical protein